MQLAMTISVRQEQILGLRLAGGTSTFIFPAVEAAISESKDAQRALMAITGGPVMADFASFMDFLICSVLPEIKPLCFRFYWDKGLPLRDQITEEGRDNLEILLLAALESALVYFENNAETSWERMRGLLLTLGVPKIRLYPLGPAALDELAEAAA